MCTRTTRRSGEVEGGVEYTRQYIVIYTRQYKYIYIIIIIVNINKPKYGHAPPEGVGRLKVALNFFLKKIMYTHRQKEWGG
jgi:hypothetical protein